MSMFRTRTKRERDFAERNGVSTKPPLTEFGANNVLVETPRVLSRTDTDLSTAPSYPSPVRAAPQNSSKKWTQEDQDETDDEDKRKAMKDLVTSWMDRLQLISVITTFFAAMEAQLLQVVTPEVGTFLPNILLTKKISLATLASAMIIHIFAAILSFVAAFFLVRFRLHEAVHKEYEAELSGGSPKVFVGSTSQNPSPRVSISNADPAGTTLSQKSSTEGPTINHIEPPPADGVQHEPAPRAGGSVARERAADAPPAELPRTLHDPVAGRIRTRNRGSDDVCVDDAAVCGVYRCVGVSWAVPCCGSRCGCVAMKSNRQ